MLTNFTLTYFSCLSSAITNPKQVVFGSCYTSRSRSPSDQIAFAARSDGVRSTMTFAIILHNISVGLISHKWGI